MAERAASDPPLLRIEAVAAGYGQNQILHGVSIDVPTGTTVCLLGANGTGKSTLLKAVLGYVACQEGSITLDGHQIQRWPTHRRVSAGIRYVPQGHVVFEQMTVRENLLLGAHLDRARAARGISHAIELFPQLGGFLERKAGVLSGGEQQMVAVSRALMLPASVMVLDEPSAGLSPKYVHLLFEGLDRARSEGLTMLLTEQNAAKALEFGDYAYVLDRGTVATHGSTQVLRDREDFRGSYLNPDALRTATYT